MWMCGSEEPSYYKYYVELYIFMEQEIMSIFPRQWYSMIFNGYLYPIGWTQIDMLVKNTGFGSWSLHSS